MFKERYNWIGDEDEINHISRGDLDTDNSIVLRPLEIRSWRINLKEEIVDREMGNNAPALSPDTINKVESTD
jgi:hypothetical protein